MEKNAIVTGAGSGIGRAIALELADRGCNVAICGRRIEPINETAELVRAKGRKAYAASVDVADGASVQAFVDAAIAELGSVDILVNNAGLTRDTLLMRMTEADWDVVLDTNLKGAFLFCKAVARPMMKQRSGAIVNISSVVGQTGNAGQVNYASSKAGLIALTKSVARELASRNIRANAVAPGFIVSPMTDSLPETAKNAILNQVPAGRLGTAADIAKAVAFLCSDDASYITGQTLGVNGGFVM